MKAGCVSARIYINFSIVLDFGSGGEYNRFGMLYTDFLCFAFIDITEVCV